MARPKKSVQEKMKDANPEFVMACEGLSIEQLDSRLAGLAKDAESINEAKENDTDLAAAKETASSLGAPYRETKKAVKLKTKYVLQLIKERS
jgi:hypothetical protein